MVGDGFTRCKRSATIDMAGVFLLAGNCKKPLETSPGRRAVQLP